MTFSDPVHRHAALAGAGRALSAAGRPAQAQGARSGVGLHPFQLPHGGQQAQVYVPDGEGSVQHRFPQSLGDPGGGNLGRTGHDGEYADLLRRKAGLGLRLPPGQDSGQFHRQDGAGHMVDELWEAHADQPHHGGAGGGDLGRYRRTPPAQDAFMLKGRDQLGRTGHLPDLVKADLQKAVQNDVHIVQVLELCVKRGLGQRHAVRKLLQPLQSVAHGLDGLVGTHADTIAAVDAAVGQNGGLAPAHTDRLRGAALDAGGAAPAAPVIQDYGMPHAHGALSPPLAG